MHVNRKKVIYLGLAAAVIVALLVILGLYNVWLMLMVILLVVIVTGNLYQNRKDVSQKLSTPSCKAHKSGNGRSASLVLAREDAGSVEQIVINKTVFKIGRDPDCDYVVSRQPYISGVHAIIRTKSKEKCAYIMDNHSHNGIFINNSRIAPDCPVRLSVGDVIQLGTLRFTVQNAHF